MLSRRAHISLACGDGALRVFAENLLENFMLLLAAEPPPYLPLIKTRRPSEKVNFNGEKSVKLSPLKYLLSRLVVTSDSMAVVFK